MKNAVLEINNKKESLDGLKERNLEFLKKMLQIRAFEENVLKLYHKGRLLGVSPHLSIGQEAMAVGTCAALRREDYIITTHRGHGHCIAKGAKLRPMMAELCGKESGYCKGRGGTMHIADVSLGILGANGIVGGGLPMACGVGLSIKYRNANQVCVVFFGDGASNQGTFHESVNFACAFKLPLIFICENNLYAISVLYEKVAATPNVADRAKGYDMPGVIIDGNDIEEVYSTVCDAVKRVRKGEGPILIEGKTYRHLGHGASDHRPYRTRDEENRWKSENDPINRLKEAMIASGQLDESCYEKIKETALADADDALEYADSSPKPDPKDALKYIYV